MPKVRIVIPFHNHWDLTHTQLWSLYKHEKRTIDRVLLVDDASTDDEVLGGMKWWKQDVGLPVSYISLENNLNFLKASNLGLYYFVGMEDKDPNDIIILLSNDVKIRGGFIEQIIEEVSKPKTLVGGVLYSHDTGWNTFDGVTYPYLEGWLLATTLGNWMELGLFDERYAPCDFEDVDLSTQALKMGYNLVALNNPALQHLGGQTLGYNPEREAQTKINREKFREKWIKNNDKNQGSSSV